MLQVGFSGIRLAWGSVQQVRCFFNFLKRLKRLKKKSSRKKNKEHSLKANDIKKQLLQKIKEQQKKSQEAFSKEITKKQSGENKLDTDFKTSIDYLNVLSKEKKEKR